MDETPIRAVLFDYGGVLVRTVDPRPRQQLERRFDLQPGQVYDLVFGSPLWDDVQHGRTDGETFWRDVGERLGLNDEALRAFRRGFWGGDKLDEELLDVVRELRELGYKTAVLSNAPSSLAGYLEELDIVEAFDSVIISADEGVTKPAPEIFDRALDRVGVGASEAVFIDDTPVNVEAARRVGLHATRFRGLPPLRIWLRELGVALSEPEREPVPDPKAVIFDWGGVMEELPNEEDIAAWERRLATATGALPDILWGGTWQRLAVGATSAEDYVCHVVEQLGLPDRDAALDFLRAFYTSDRFHHGVMDAARALRERYKVAVLSNAFPAQVETIREQYGIDVHAEFDVYVNSAMVGMSKPDPGIYELTLERLAVAPSQAIFLDDTLRNVDAARELGLHAIQFVRPDVSLAVLEELLGHPIT